MPREKLVKIVSKSGSEAKVAEKSVAVYERHGWTRADDGSSTPEPAGESEPDSPPPAKKTAAKKATTRKAD